MIRFKLEEVMLSYRDRNGDRSVISINQLSKETGISRLSLSRVHKGTAKGIEVQTLDTLCAFFGCSVGDLIEHVTE